MLIDSHAHLNDERLLKDVDAIVSECGNYGVESVICVGYDRASSLKAAELAEKYACIYAAVAFHPHDSKSYTEDDADLFCVLAKNTKVVAIGETGLDYYYDLSERSVQKRVFAAHLELADGLKLPVAVHVRDAYGDTLDILKQNKKYLNNGIIIHNYSGDIDTMREFDAFGCYYSFGGTLTFKNNRKGAESFIAAERSRILLETDCPYLTPEPHRGKLNYPYYVKYVAEKGAALLDIDYGEFVKLTNHNTKTLFKRLK
ncbi:MAG: TatD family hydrolase [Clostridiales bacterium]|jgi:TatD DNase family protein|nr:TatD family hydrolase [Clostridiales bacterium]